MKALWLPYQIDNLDRVRKFYAGLGLSETDSWDRDGEHGVVIRAAPAAYLEFVAPGWSGPPPLAFELATAEEVDAAFAELRPAELIVPPHRYPRGHYGFELRDPAGNRVQMWSENHDRA